MAGSTPRDTMSALIAARGSRDVEAAFACYEPTATVVIEPGKTASGPAAIRAFIASAARLPITFGNRVFVETGDTALHISEWKIMQPDEGNRPQELVGRTADVFRRQGDGSWLIAIDNPWGVTLLD
jgi:ketosteroid isomerase-like protein